VLLRSLAKDRRVASTFMTTLRRTALSPSRPSTRPSTLQRGAARKAK